jgi:hypothetical protein
MKTRRWIVTAAVSLAAVIWAGTVAAAYRAIRLFESTPGEAANAPAQWPAASIVPRAGNEWSLVMLVHPHCSCSRASVEELRAVLDKAPADLRTYVLVYRPADSKPGWEQTQVVQNASTLRRVRVIVDEEGRESKRFGGFTSGQTLLYDDHGHLRFAGGMTSLRGHAGANRGRAEVLEILRTKRGSGSHPVFGCAISTRKERDRS